MHKSNSVQGNNLAEVLSTYHHTELLKIAISYLARSHMTHYAEDAVQNTYIKIITANKKTSYDSKKGPLIGWAGRIVVNACKDILRTESRKGCLSPEQVYLGDYLAQGDSDIPAESKINPLERMCAEERRVEVTRAVQELPEWGSDVIGHVSLHENNYKETAEALCIPIGTVKSRMNIAKRKLKTLLKK